MSKVFALFTVFVALFATESAAPRPVQTAMPGGAVGPTGATELDARASVAQDKVLRCCFRVEAFASISLHSLRECFADPSGQVDCLYPYGGHEVDASWQGVELAALVLAEGNPELRPLKGGEPRVRATLRDRSNFFPAPNDAGRLCNRVLSTDPSLSGGRNGWMASRQFVTFLAPSAYMHVGPPAQIARATTKCDTVAHHGEGFSVKAWDGVQEPWQWIVRAPARRSLLAERLVRVKRGVPYFCFSSATARPAGVSCARAKVPGGIYRTEHVKDGWVHETKGSISLGVFFLYVPASRLATERARVKANYPVRSKGFRLLPPS